MARLKRIKRINNENRACLETFDKCSFLFKVKEGEDFNRRNTWSISRIKI